MMWRDTFRAGWAEKSSTPCKGTACDLCFLERGCGGVWATLGLRQGEWPASESTALRRPPRSAHHWWSPWATSYLFFLRRQCFLIQGYAGSSVAFRWWHRGGLPQAFCSSSDLQPQDTPCSPGTCWFNPAYDRGFAVKGWLLPKHHFQH